MEKVNQPILWIKDLHLNYGSTSVLRGVNLELMPGEILGLMGASGSGKTSLLRAVAGFEHPQKGEVFINEQCVCSRDINKACSERSVGFVFQDLALFPHMSVEQNLFYGAKNSQDKNRGMDLAQRFAIESHFNKKPDQLSGGEKQRLALARSLVPGPKLLMMDEPFTGLDAHLRQSLLPSLRLSLKKLGVPTILVSHSFEELSQMADRVAVMDQGRLIQIAPLEEIYFRPKSKVVAELSGPVYSLVGQIENQEVRTEFGKLPCRNGKGQVQIACRQEDFIESENESGIECQVLDQLFFQGSFLLNLQSPEGFVFQMRKHKRHPLDRIRVQINRERDYTLLQDTV